MNGKEAKEVLKKFCDWQIDFYYNSDKIMKPLKSRRILIERLTEKGISFRFCERDRDVHKVLFGRLPSNKIKIGLSVEGNWAIVFPKDFIKKFSVYIQDDTIYGLQTFLRENIKRIILYKGRGDEIGYIEMSPKR